LEQFNFNVLRATLCALNKIEIQEPRRALACYEKELKCNLFQ